MGYFHKYYYPPVHFWTVWFSEAMLYYLKQNGAKLSKQNNILDIGCGLGYHCITIKNMNVNSVYGFDISKETMNLLNEFKTGVFFKGVNIVEDDISEYHDKFDIIFSSDVYEHVHSSQVMINNIHKMLSDSGVACITFPNWLHHGQNQFDNINILKGQLISGGFKNFKISVIENYSLIFRFYMKCYMLVQKLSDIVLNIKRKKDVSGGMPESDEFQDMYAFQKINKLKKYKVFLILLNISYLIIKITTRITAPFTSSNNFTNILGKRIIFFTSK